jgi:3',5'-cyclic AMP phosphodiesterase CpdA
MTSLIHISDPHFGTERVEVVAALLDWVTRTRPDLIVLSGDLTQRARPGQFQKLREFVERLDCAHVLAIPGNHDIPLFDLLERLRSPYRHYSAAMGTQLEPAYESAELLVVTVNTTRKWRRKHGEVSAAQTQRVSERLLCSGAQLRIVVTHQPVVALDAKDENNLLRGSERAAPVWSEAGADLLLGGHIHLPYVLPLSHRFSGLSRRTWVLQAGTAVSRRVRGGVPNSVNRVELTSPSSCLAQRWDYHASTSAFQCVGSVVLPLDPHPKPR